MEAGAVGGLRSVLVSLIDFLKLLPQAEVYKTLMLSPAADAKLDEKVITTFCELKEPESITYPDKRREPVKSQRYPVAAVADVVAKGRDGALYRYFLAPHIFVCKGVMVIEVGAVGTESLILISLADRMALCPHPENALTRIESPLMAASLDVYLTLITLEFVISPESTIAPVTPPTELGIVHVYPAPLVTVLAVYLYTLEPHTLDTSV